MTTTRPSPRQAAPRDPAQTTEADLPAIDRLQRPQPRRFRRLRRALRWIGATVGALVVVFLSVLGWLYQRADISTAGELDFANPLHIPPLLEPSVHTDGTKVFDLRFTAGTTEFLDDVHTPTWGLNGAYLSPTLRAERGDRVTVNVTNNVDETTTLHWHGMKLPAVMDGGPHQPIEPGQTWSPTWEIDQPAATLWFHPHLHDATADHVYRGAAGLFLLDDPDESPDLPEDYGVDDIPIIIQDKAFKSDGTLDNREPAFSFVGTLGDQIVINGTHNPHLDVVNRRVRLRVLNASNARIFKVGFADERSFQLIATDSGLLESPVSLTDVQLSPGERAEIVVTVDPGERIALRSEPPDLGMNFFTERMNGGDDTFDLVELRAADTLAPSPEVPERLTEVEPLPPADADTTRRFELTDLAINGLKMDPGRVDVVVPAGATEIWELHNSSGTPHSFHPHLVNFRILDIDGRDPPAQLSGLKDTIYVPPGSTIRIIATFEGTADAGHPFMYHCHILQHEDAGMMGQFTLDDRPTGRRDTAPRIGHNELLPPHEHERPISMSPSG